MEKTYKGKAKVRAKIDKAKRKIARKVKGKDIAAVALFLCLSCLVSGCMETQPASRATTATYGDIVVKLGEKSHGNTVTITLGDGALASADSAGSTETQTATPSMSIPVRIDARYNDPVKSGGDAITAALKGLTPAAQALLEKAIGEKYTGTLDLEKTDGSKVQVECKDGVCTPCTDGSCAK